MTTTDNLLQLNQLPENNKNPIAESNNDYDISMDIETRIAELRTCPVWEDHVRMLEDLLRKADEVASKYYNNDVETMLKLQKANGIVKAQQDELEAISFALGTNEGHSSVDHIVTLKAEVERLKEDKMHLTAYCADLLEKINPSL